VTIKIPVIIKIIPEIFFILIKYFFALFEKVKNLLINRLESIKGIARPRE
jgi:hypothetical protein